jgi:hypothetical protein
MVGLGECLRRSATIDDNINENDTVDGSIENMKRWRSQDGECGRSQLGKWSYPIIKKTRGMYLQSVLTQVNILHYFFSIEPHLIY